VLDLLNLIGKAIETLQCSIELFEDSCREDGLKQLSSVIAEIDHYLERMDDDPLLRIASVDRVSLREHLQGVKGELASVIESFGPNTAYCAGGFPVGYHQGKDEKNGEGNP